MAQRINVKTMFALLITATGTAWAQDAAPVDQAQPVAQQPTEDKPAIKLLDAGKGDKFELRYAPKIGQSFLLTMSMDTSMELSMAGQQMPAQDIPTTTSTIRITTTKIEGDAIHYAMVVESMRAEGGPMAEMLNGMLKSIKGVKGTGIMSDRGENRSMQFEAPAGQNPMMAQSMSSMEDTLRNAATFLPQEKVGVGAKWQAVYTMDADGINMKQTMEYTLGSFNDGVAKLEVKMTQSAEPQSVTNDQLPPGMTLDLKSLKGTGKGTSTINLGWLVPLETAGTSTTTVVMSAAQMGEMSQTVSVKIDMASKPVE